MKRLAAIWMLLSSGNKKDWIICFTILALHADMVAQNQLPFRHINNEQGLSNSTVECIYQDSKGFIWFGTRDGLNRYDGHNMEVFRNIPGDTNSISENFIRDIVEDRSGKIWVATFEGLNCFDPDQHRFIRFRHDPRVPGTLSSNLITHVYEDKKGRLWIGTFGGGLNVLGSEPGKFKQYRARSTESGNLSDDRVNCILEDRKGNLWVGTERGLNLMDRDNESFYVFDVTSTPQMTPADNKVRYMQEDLQGDLWLASENTGLLRFEVSEQRFSRHPKLAGSTPSYGNMIRSLLVDSKGNLWIGSINGGLSRFDASRDTLINFQNNPNEPTSLSQRTASAVLEDREGNLWVGTHRGGVNYYSPNARKFRLFRRTVSPNSLSYNDVKAFCEDSQGYIWIGTDGGGLNRFDRKSGIFTHYRFNPGNAGSIGSDEVLHVMEDSRGDIWVSTWGGGLNLFDRKTGTFTRFQKDPRDNNSISSNYVQKAFEDRQGRFWVATYFGGLNEFDRRERRFTRVVQPDEVNQRISGQNIISIEQDRDSRIWIGTDDGGLNCYDPVNKSLSYYFKKEDKYPDLRVLFSDSKGRLWVGQRGLYLFDTVKDDFVLHTEREGLDREFIKGITEDDAGNLWISTSNGITRYHPDNGTTNKYNAGDGLQGPEFEANAYLRTRDGEMYFGGINGFNSFYPQSIRSNRFIPPVYITEMQIFNRKVLPGREDSPLQRALTNTTEITLTHEQSTISFFFAALNFTLPENNRYEYTLEGFETEWHDGGTEQKATYTNLDPGEYVFRVRGSNNDGVWNESGTSLRIVIRPPFWSTWWFKLVMLAALLSLVYFALLTRKRRELKKIEDLKREEIHQMQLQFFTNISHEFRTPLTLIAGPLEKLLKDEPRHVHASQYRMMYRNAHRLLNLLNELMDFRKVEAGALKLKVMPGDISLFLQEIAEEYRELAWQKKIHFSARNLYQHEEVWFDRQILEKIVLNLLNNAFKYTMDEGNITIEVLPDLESFKPSFENELIILNEHRSARQLHIRVADTGIGISKESITHLFQRYYRISDAHLGSGVGLAFVKSLTALHKGDIRVYSSRRQGTEFIISLPVEKSDYGEAERWTSSNGSGVMLESISAEHVLVNPATVSNLSANKRDEKRRNEHILIVDDNAELREFLRQSLDPLYRVTEAVNGQNGIVLAREVVPDLIITDVMMPLMDGYEFCKLLKEDISTSHIPVIMLTAKNTVTSSIEGVESGADFYFSKPLSMELLELTIRNLFEQKRRLKDRFSREYFSEARELANSSRDKEFVDELLRIIESQLINPELDVEHLCSQMGMSRTKLYQKIKSITGQPIGEFIRTIRLKKAAYIMTHEDVPLSEVMYRIGIQTQSYFTKAFKKEFGKTPTQFMQELNK